MSVQIVCKLVWGLFNGGAWRRLKFDVRRLRKEALLLLADAGVLVLWANVGPFLFRSFL